MVFGERRIHDPPAALVEFGRFSQGQTEAHDDATAELACCQARVENPAGIERAQEARHAGFAGDGIDPHFAELRAVGMHRELLHLHRRRRIRVGRNFLYAGAREDRDVAFEPRRIVTMA